MAKSLKIVQFGRQIIRHAVRLEIGAQHQAAAKRGPVPKLQQQMDRITQLPRARQQFVMEVIESVLAQASR